MKIKFYISKDKKLKILRENWKGLLKCNNNHNCN